MTLIHRRDAFRAEAPLIRAARQTANIHFKTPCVVTGLQGTEQLEALNLRYTDGREEVLPVQAVFVAMGRVPDCSLIAGYADLDAVGCVDAGEDCRTKTPGLYVAGDCRSKHIRQLTTAVADGTVAATAACEYLDAME